MNAVGHSKFIVTPISTIIGDTNRACSSLGTGIEIHPLASYIMQTTFLRMTGASEQKLKCICWEIASFDYEFRYEMLRSPLGECSSYEDKNKILGKICKSLERFDNPPEFSDAEKDAIINHASTNLLHILRSSSLSLIFDKEFKEFENYCSVFPITRTMFFNRNRDAFSLLESSLKSFYSDFIYRQRNRYAHNLTSYQFNLPTFTQLLNTRSEDKNHFRMIAVLILIDHIFIGLFNKFLEVRNFHSY